MSVLGVLMIGAGVYLVYYAWESHKTGTPPTPVQHAAAAIGGAGNQAAINATLTAGATNPTVGAYLKAQQAANG